MQVTKLMERVHVLVHASHLVIFSYTTVTYIPNLRERRSSKKNSTSKGFETGV